MSHFTQVRTRITERKYLVQALEDMGHAIEEGATRIGGYQGQSEAVDLKLEGLDIGFCESEGAYAVVADWYVIGGIQQGPFVEQLNQRYAYHATRGELEAQGFEVAEEDTEKGGRIRLVLRRMA